MNIYLVCLIGVCLLVGIIERATAGYRWLIRHNRRWPREQHPSYFRDLKRGYFPEDLS